MMFNPLAPLMMSTLLGLKFVFFMALIRAYVKFEPLQDRPIFIAFLYTLGVVVLSYVFYFGPNAPPNDPAYWARWRWWVGVLFGLSVLYFWLLSKFSEAGMIWWVILLLGLGLVWF